MPTRDRPRNPISRQQRAVDLGKVDRFEALLPRRPHSRHARGDARIEQQEPPRSLRRQWDFRQLFGGKSRTAQHRDDGLRNTGDHQRQFGKLGEINHSTASDEERALRNTFGGDGGNISAAHRPDSGRAEPGVPSPFRLHQRPSRSGRSATVWPRGADSTRRTRNLSTAFARRVGPRARIPVCGPRNVQLSGVAENVRFSPQEPACSTAIALEGETARGDDRSLSVVPRNVGRENPGNGFKTLCRTDPRLRLSTIPCLQPGFETAT